MKPMLNKSKNKKYFSLFLCFHTHTCTKEMSRLTLVSSRKSFDAFNRDYFAGIESNLKLVNQMYGPEWVMRLYYQMPNKESQNWSKLCHLVCNNPQLDICDIEHNPKYGKSYHFSCFSSRFVNSFLL